MLGTTHRVSGSAEVAGIQVLFGEQFLSLPFACPAKQTGLSG